MGFRGGGKICPPPQRILVFKYLSRDRVIPLPPLMHLNEKCLYWIDNLKIIRLILKFIFVLTFNLLYFGDKTPLQKYKYNNLTWQSTFYPLLHSLWENQNQELEEWFLRRGKCIHLAVKLKGMGSQSFAYT